MNIIAALETGETTPLGVVRTLKVGKEWRNDEDGRRKEYNKISVRKRQA